MTQPGFAEDPAAYVAVGLAVARSRGPIVRHVVERVVVNRRAVPTRCVKLRAPPFFPGAEHALRRVWRPGRDPATHRQTSASG
jgi:hypothetical protein